jgi:zinc/manganese transport system substrate-binding protein
MRRFISSALFAVLAAAHAEAAIKVFACEPEWGALASEVGGTAVEVFIATNARQDPHRVEARPTLLARARNAQLLLCTGAELEAGWLPPLLQQAGNAAIQAGQAGHLMFAEHVTRLEIPSRLDRAEGDIHPAGNPHIHYDPRNIARVVPVLADRLAKLDPAAAGAIQARAQQFLARWNAAVLRWEEQAQALRGGGVVQHHKHFSYLFQWLGIRVVASLEPKPGVEPSTSHLTGLLKSVTKDSAFAIVRAPFNDERPSAWLAERTAIPALLLPLSVGGTPDASDLFKLFDVTVARLLAAKSQR